MKRTTFNSLVMTGMLTLIQPMGNAQPFVFNTQDLLLNFRATDAGATDPNLTINLGPVTQYRDATDVIVLDPFGTDLLLSVFGSLDNLAFSATASEVNEGAAFPRMTVWATRPRVDPDIQSDPWQRFNTLNSSQGATAGKINSIGDNAAASGAALSSTATVTEDGSPLSYKAFITSSGNFSASFQGNIENSTGIEFSGPAVLRSDLYEMQPGSGPGVYYGYFELNSAGQMVFVPEPGTWALLALGGLALVFLGRRKLRA